MIMHDVIFEKTVEGTLEGVRKARLALISAAQASAIPSETADRLALGLSEVASNVVRHAVLPPARIAVQLGRRDGGYILDVADDASTFQDLNDRMASASLPDQPSEGGMGLGLVATLFARIAYTPKTEGTDGLNRLRMEIEAPETAADPHHILIVDDDPSFLRIMSLYLRDDYRVTACDGASAALSFLTRHRPDLILSDICMPDMSGLAFGQAVRRNPQTETIPFVFLTSRTDQATVSAATELAIDDFLVKPTTKERTLSVIRRALKRAAFAERRQRTNIDNAITTALQPSLPGSIPGFKGDLRWRTAATGGGDLVFHRQGKNGTLIVLADIMGHGEAAKFFGFAVAGYLNGLLASFGDAMSPGLLLAKLSDFAHHDPILRDTVLTAVVVLLTSNGEAVIAGAGHSPPLCAGPEGVRSLPVQGPLLGLINGMTYDDHICRLSHDERLVLYTDGMVEAGNDCSERLRSEQTFVKAFANHSTTSLSEAADGLMAAFDGLTRGAPNDDATLILIERNET